MRGLFSGVIPGTETDIKKEHHGKRLIPQNTEKMVARLIKICKKKDLNPLGILNSFGYRAAHLVPKKKWSGIIGYANLL